MSQMPYKKLDANVALWSPYTWGWKCESCPCVTIHDGRIFSKKDVEVSRKDQDRKDLFKMVGMLLGYKKKAKG